MPNNGIDLDRTTTVGSYIANAFGLYDMHGNVWEWCLDWYVSYPSGSVTDPRGAATGSSRVFRGGSWNGLAQYCRSAIRGFAPDFRDNVLGFRLVLAQPTKEPVPIPAMVKIPEGTFVMGSPLSEEERGEDESQHTVTISYDFYMSKYEVTQKEYLAVMGNNPSYFTTKDWNGKPISPDLNRPVEQVSWNEAIDYCAKITTSEKAAGRLPVGWIYRLPTEAEWEYACRAGTTTVFHYGDILRSGMANFRDRYEYLGGNGTVENPNGTFLARTMTVGSYVANAFGLYDMHGNVWEWCLDWLDNYPSGSVTDPRGPNTGSFRALRGASWGDSARNCRSAARGISEPGLRYFHLGFRPVLAPGQ